jgi:hypothetical protein
VRGCCERVCYGEGGGVSRLFVEGMGGCDDWAVGFDV